MTDPFVSAVVVNYNAEPAVLARCLASLRGQTYSRLEVLVVDNGSPPGRVDAVLAAFPDARLLRLEENFGFAGGVNRGVAAAHGELVMVLNFDVELAPDCVERLAAAMRDDECLAGVAPKTVFMHDRHLIAVTERDRPYITGDLIRAFTYTGTRAEIAEKLTAAEAAGVTEIAFQPAGPDIPRELLVPLVRASVDNWAALGPQRALTGPIARGDEVTVARQRAAVAERAPDLLAMWKMRRKTASWMSAMTKVRRFRTSNRSRIPKLPIRHFCRSVELCD